MKRARDLKSLSFWDSNWNYTLLCSRTTSSNHSFFICKMDTIDPQRIKLDNVDKGPGAS